MIRPTASLSTLTALLACLSSCSKAPPSEAGDAPSPPAEVTVVEVRAMPFVDRSIAIGNLQSAESVDISASVTERVEALHFEDGQQVEKGDVLATLEQSEEAALIQMAETELAEELREIERLESLADTRAVAEVTIEERRTRGLIAEARIKSVRAQKEERTILAPFSGRVGLRQISPGALIEPGTVITTLDQIDTMKLDFTVPEVFLSQLQQGTSLIARTSAFPNEDFEAKIATVDSRVDPVTRSILVRAILPNAGLRLRPGMLMTVELQRNQREALAIPERAVIPRRNTKSVYVIEDGIATIREIEAGTRIPGYLEVLSGLKSGDLVVTDGLLSLRDGAEVKIADYYDEPTPAFDPRTGTSS